MHDEITTTIREIRSLEATIKKATRMKEARKQKLIDRWNDLKDQHGLTLKGAARITGYPQHSLVNTFYGGQSPFFTPDRWAHFFEKIFSHIRKKSLATQNDDD